MDELPYFLFLLPSNQLFMNLIFAMKIRVQKKIVNKLNNNNSILFSLSKQSYAK